MSNEIAIRESQHPAVARPTEQMLTTLAEIQQVANACAKSGYYKDIRDASQAVVKMLAGRELGIGPVTALAHIHIVEGKPAAGATLLGAMVKRSGRYDYRVKNWTNDACEIAWFDRNEEIGVSSFTEADAKRAGLAGKHNWKTYPKAMYFARALTQGIRAYCPDAAGGVVYTPEELQPAVAASEDGEPVNPQAPEPRDVTPEPREESQYISEAQRRRLFAITGEECKKSGLSADFGQETVRQILAERGIESTKEIPRDEYESICEDATDRIAAVAAESAGAPEHGDE